MTKHHSRLPVPDVDALIVTVRGQKVLLDSDLARIYGVPTFRFNEAVKRNQHRFPPDFRFQLTAEEWAAVKSLRSQNAILNAGGGLNSSRIAMSSSQPVENKCPAPDGPPFVSSPKLRRGAAYRPWAYTEGDLCKSPVAALYERLRIVDFLENIGGHRPPPQRKATIAEVSEALDNFCLEQIYSDN
jgi:hypothetical protein